MEVALHLALHLVFLFGEVRRGREFSARRRVAVPRDVDRLEGDLAAREREVERHPVRVHQPLPDELAQRADDVVVDFGHPAEVVMFGADGHLHCEVAFGHARERCAEPLLQT